MPEEERASRGARALQKHPLPEDGSGEAAKRSQDPSMDAELRRLEAMLARVRDDAGSLLANRFARQLATRGAPHQDPGPRW